MRQPSHAVAADELPPQAAPSDGAKPAGWKLTADAPEPDVPLARDRAGAAGGMVLLLVGGGLFWIAVAAAIFFLTR